MADHPTGADGRAARARIRRGDQAELHLPEGRDAVGILEAQHANRLPDLVPVRVGRMLQSPFTFYRGSAAVMAADLRDAPTSGFDVVACGDAHLSNFGFYASPERDLVFDLNDFDEAGFAPWEWDVRRLTASIHVGGRDIGLTEQQCREATQAAVETYTSAMGEALDHGALERYFLRADHSEIARRIGRAGTKMVNRAAKKARTRTADQVLRKLGTVTDCGTVRIVDQPPVLRHVDHASLEELDALFREYRRTVREDIAYLLQQFTLVDYALRVVGVGSVGTGSYLIALQGPSGEVLFLQAKQAQESVLSSHGGRPTRIVGLDRSEVSEGRRVVAAQRVLQSSSDPFLGWITGWAAANSRRARTRVDYYWRQFRDMKGAIDVSRLTADEMTTYGRLCATLLARAHAQSPTAFAIQGYLGTSGGFAEATSRWAAAYADVAEADFEALGRAVASGRLAAETGV